MKKDFHFFGLDYAVSSDGKIYGQHNIELKQRLDEDGYPVITIGSKYIKRKVIRIHRIIAILFVDNPENKPEVNHIDGIKTNNNYTNLEWATRSEQMVHAFKLGLKSSKGVKNGRAVLSESDVRQIRKLYNKGWKIFELRDKFDCGWSTINNIVLGNTWTSLE